MSSVDLGAVFGAGGLLAQALSGYAPRRQQQELAERVLAAIEERSDLIAEAGTGTGKTYAYLVPALLSGARVIISTGTKALQDQLFHRDLPQVRKALGRSDVRSALLKGRSNYLCLYRIDRAQREGRFESRHQLDQFNKIRLFAARTRDGDRAECQGVPEDAPVWAQVTSTADNCLGSTCAFYADCHLVRARKRAMESELVVVNHHLLFADMAVRREGFGEVLPGAHAFVIDEAHQLVEAAGMFFTTSLSLRQLTELGRDALAESAIVPGTLPKVQPAVGELGQALRKLRLSLSEVPARGQLAAVLEIPEVREPFEQFSATLAGLTAFFAELAQSSEGLKNIADRCEEVQQALQLISAGLPDGHVRWYEVTRNGFALHATPLDVAGPLREHKARTKAAWILTSATLAVGDRFDHVKHETGFFEAGTLKLDSPFDYAQQALLYLPPGLPEPNQPGYTRAVVEAALPVLTASQGRAFLLFTSHRALGEAAELLKEHGGWPLFVQGEAPRAQLLEQFRQSGNGVLLGAASFWEGVDVRGDALSLVVIDKLPFAQIQDPVVEARMEDIRARGGSPFGLWQLPQAAITLKQGAGRLIRDVHDRGVLMLCDPRVLSKAYGRTFLKSLPPMRQTRALTEVQAFFGG